jgi:broad specificity phosphatase PhoE
MSSRLIFIANASTPAVRAAAFPLNEGIDEFGRRDALVLAKEIRRDLIVLTSPAARAVETAAALGLDAKIDESLRDLDLGRWAGRALSDIAASEPSALESWLSDPTSSPHGGETVDGLFARIAIWLKDVLSRREHIIAVTHPAVARAAILAAIHAGPASFWHIDIAPLGVVELSSNGLRWTLRSIKNRTSIDRP